jgi:4-carboxymuconolactone decarboxylase
VAACVVANALQQLTVHAPAAVRCGATVQEVQEVILQMATYTGMPYMLQAMRHFDTLRENMEQLEQEFKAGKLPPV